MQGKAVFERQSPTHTLLDLARGRRSRTPPPVRPGLSQPVAQYFVH
jgi:hypothetical protein